MKTVDELNDDEILQFHIPNPFKVGEDVAQISAGEVKKILNKVLPDVLKNLPDEILHEIVQKVIIPVLSDVLKPIEKEVFKTGVNVMEAMHTEMKAIMGGATAIPKHLIDQAWKYYLQGDDPVNRQNWGRLLLAFGQHDDSFVHWWSPMTAKEAWLENAKWSGWRPFAEELDVLEGGGGDTGDLLKDFDKIQFNCGFIGNVGVTLWFTEVYSRMPGMIATLRRYENTGLPAKRHDILNFLRAMGPNWINIDTKAELDIGIDFGASVSAWNIPTPLAYRLLDTIMETAGVPE